MRVPLSLFAVVLLSGCATGSVLPAEETVMPGADNAYARTGDIELDVSQSTVEFTTKVAGESIQGGFRSFGLEMNLGVPRIRATIDVRTLFVSSDYGLDTLLMTPEFFDTAQYPLATFTVTTLESKGNNEYILTGDMTVKGVTQEVTVPAVITNDALSVEFSLSRMRFGIGDEIYEGNVLPDEIPVKAVFGFAPAAQ